MSDAIVLVAARRTPFGKYLGALSALDPLELAEAAATGALTQAGLADTPGAIDRLFMGNCFGTSFSTPSVIARQLGLWLGIDGFAVTIDTACCSPVTALRLAVQGMRAGEFRSALVVGVESMSRIPHLARGLRSGVRAGAITLQDPIYPIEYKGYAPVAVDAQLGARKYDVTREDMDAFAARSHERWNGARQAKFFADEIVPVTVEDHRRSIIVHQDEQPRPDTTPEKLAMLKGIFGTEDITAGNAPGLNDGATAVVVMTASRATELGLVPLATLVAEAGVTESPNGISWVPATAIEKVLALADRPLDAMQLLEINEAFAAMPLVSTKKLAGFDPFLAKTLLDKTNVNGGAVAIGHPVGASGLRILAALAYELRRRGGGQGVAAICGGLSQGEAVLLEV
jgi:acetyl-CoA C-acetyltransferase